VGGQGRTLAALAEFRRGAGQDAETLLVLTCEHIGIGGTVLHNGAPFIGSGHAVEAGHLRIGSGKMRCPCGQTGCMELYADGRALIEAAGCPDPYEKAIVAPLLDKAAQGRHW
jgi:predicted NBD/HSP70 family sugar kinase